MDIWPTLCEIANLNPPKGYPIDGFTRQKQFKGDQNPNRNELFLNHFPHGNHRSNYFTSLVKGEWKVIYHYPLNNQPHYELYHLKKDPFETTNLAEKKPKKLNKMMTLLLNELKDKGALYPEKEKQALEPIIPIIGK